MSDQQATPAQPVHSFSFAAAMEALDELYEAIPKSRRPGHLGAFNEAAVVLTSAAGLLGVNKGHEQWGQPLSMLPKFVQVPK